MASRKDIEAGRAHVLLYIKNQVQAGLQVAAQNLKQFAAVTTQVAGRLNQLASIATMAGGAILGPMIAAVTQLEEAKGPLDDIKKALAEGIGRPLLPLLTTVRNIVVSFADWAKRNPQIVRMIALIGAGLIGAGIAAKLVASGLMLVAGAATIASVASTALAALLSPAGLIVAGVVALGVGIVAAAAAWLKFTKSGQSAWSTFIGTVGSGLKGVVDAISSGRIELAWKIVVTTMKLLFFQMVQGVMDKIVDLIEFIADNEFVRFILGDAVTGIAAGARGVGSATIAKLTADLKKLNEEAAKSAALGVPVATGAAAVAPAGVAALHPQQTAMTTHEALALTFGTKQQVPRNEETQILKEIQRLLKNGLDKDAALLQDLLKEMRRGGPKFGK